MADSIWGQAVGQPVCQVAEQSLGQIVSPVATQSTSILATQAGYPTGRADSQPAGCAINQPSGQAAYYWSGLANRLASQMAERFAMSVGHAWSHGHETRLRAQLWHGRGHGCGFGSGHCNRRGHGRRDGCGTAVVMAMNHGGASQCAVLHCTCVLCSRPREQCCRGAREHLSK